jgi:hypothetical protein
MSIPFSIKGEVDWLTEGVDFLEPLLGSLPGA